MHRAVVVAAVLAVGTASATAVVVRRDRAGSGTRGVTPAAVRTGADVRPFVHSVRLTRAVRFDRGSLRLDAPTGAPTRSERSAVAVFRAGSPPTTAVGDVVVFLANARLGARTVVRPGDGVRPAVVPRFDGRLAWVVMWTNGPHSCPSLGADSARGPEPQPVLMVAADNAGEGVLYRTRGVFCGRRFAPRAEVARYYASVPWFVASRNGTQVTVRYRLPACGDPGLVTGGSAPTRSRIDIYAVIAMARPPCRSSRASSASTAITRTIPVGSRLTHERAGLAVGRFTVGGFAFFDGHVRHG